MYILNFDHDIQIKQIKINLVTQVCVGTIIVTVLQMKKMSHRLGDLSKVTPLIN